MKSHHDVIVIGAGAIGAACARELARDGRSVLVLDRGGGHGEAWAAAGGMLAPQVETILDDPLFELGLASRNRYGELAPELEDTTGISVGLWQEGIAHVAQDEAHVDDLRARVAWQRQQGHLCDWLDAEEVKQRWPWLGETHGALWAPEDGMLDPVKLVEALMADAGNLGASVHQAEATALESRGGKVTGVTAGSETFGCDAAVLAAGAWSSRIAGLPRPVSVAPVRGQMASLPWPADTEPAIIYGHRCYVIGRGDEAIVGSTMENAGFDASVTSAGLAQIFSEVANLCPGFATADVGRTWAGLRPMTPDGIPIVGSPSQMEGLWVATGHGRNGILLAAITGLTIAQMMAGEPTTVEDLSALDPDRFWQW